MLAAGRAAARNWRGRSAPAALDRRRPAAGDLRRGHRLHRRPRCPRRHWPGRAGRAAGLHRHLGRAEPVDSRDLVLGDLTAVGILGASAGPGARDRVLRRRPGQDPAGIVDVTVGLERAAERWPGRSAPQPGNKVHIDPRL